MKNLFQFSRIGCFTLLTVLSGFFLLSSCKQKTDYAKEIALLDSISDALSIAEKSLLSADTVSLNTMCSAFTTNLNDLTEKLSKDTVAKKTALFLSTAYEQTAHIRNLLTNKTFYIKAIRESRQRINNLRHDLKENLIEKNKSAAYIVNELNSAGKIHDAVQGCMENVKSASSRLDSLKTEIISFADSLKN